MDIQAMLVCLTLPFYDFFCGFRSVAINSVINCILVYIYTEHITFETMLSVGKMRLTIFILTTIFLFSDLPNFS